MTSIYLRIENCNDKKVIENLCKNHSKEKTMKNFKTHKKLNVINNNINNNNNNINKYKKIYRTNCDLLLLLHLPIFQILLLLVTFTNCSSEFNNLSINSNNPNNNNSNILFSKYNNNNNKQQSEFINVNNNNNNNQLLSDNNNIFNKKSVYDGRLIDINNSNYDYNDDNDDLADNDDEFYDSIHLTNSNINNNYINNNNNKNNNINNNKVFQKKMTDLEKLQEIVMQGLGLKSLPDGTKTNISQKEYYEKYNDYLKLVKERRRRELNEFLHPELIDELFDSSIITFAHNKSENHPFLKRRKKRSIEAIPRDIVYVRFPVKVDTDPLNEIEEANLRLLLIVGNRMLQVTNSNNTSHSNHHNHHHHESEAQSLHLKVYQLIEPYGRIWLDGKKLHISPNDTTTSRWLEFDVTKAVKGWVSGKQSNLGLEVHCDHCHKHGAYIIEDASSMADAESNPILNIIGNFGTRREKRSRQHHHFMQNARRKVRKTDCYQENQKCCRHTMEVVFKEIKGFEFIIQPKVFDAGYCRGKCPPRYNPAHHHALLQSLIWKQDRSKVPRPCCAPSKLVELEVLHVDEKDNKKLKVSTWSDMRVLECACS